MNNKEYFEKVVTDKSYGLCAAPLNAQTAINILCDYLLGEDFYIAMPMNAEQCNTVIVDNILSKYSKEYKKKCKKRKAVQNNDSKRSYNGTAN